MRDSQPVATFVVFCIMIIMIMSFLVGCSTTVPVAVQFPAPPESADKNCAPLGEISPGVKLSELTATVATNYRTYHECANSVTTWREWYQRQKSIFESVK